MKSKILKNGLGRIRFIFSVDIWKSFASWWKVEGMKIELECINSTLGHIERVIMDDSGLDPIGHFQAKLRENSHQADFNYARLVVNARTILTAAKDIIDDLKRLTADNSLTDPMYRELDILQKMLDGWAIMNDETFSGYQRKMFNQRLSLVHLTIECGIIEWWEEKESKFERLDDLLNQKTKEKSPSFLEVVYRRA